MAIPFRSEEIAHREYLKYQKQIEKQTEELHIDTEKDLNKIIARNTILAGVGVGLIAKHKVDKIVNVYMTAELRKYRKDLKRMITVGVDDSASFGVKSILGAVAPHRKISSQVWQNVMRRVRNRVLNTRGVDGLLLSERVWKLTGDNVHQLKKIISSGILQGDSAAKISRDIRGFLLRPETLRGRAKDLLRPGRGVYKSAYKNALRVTRTETANAYLAGQVDTAKKMGYKLQWKLSPWHVPSGCQCEDYHEQIYLPENVPARPHPQCICHTLSVLA